jgi:hypothetical protein
LNRGVLCAILIILSLMPAIPPTLQTTHNLSNHTRQTSTYTGGGDPNGTLVAFNASRAQFDIYTQQTPGEVNPGTGGGTLTWFGGNFTNTQTGTPVPNTGFNYTIQSNTVGTQNVTWPAVNIPHGNFSSTTYLKFDWRGNTGNGTKASYLVYNGTRLSPTINVTKVDQKTISGGPPSITSGTPPVACGPNDECLDVTRFIGFSLTLTFLFNSNSTGKRLSIRVSDIEVVSADSTPTNSISHSMKLDPTDSTKVIHNADLTLTYYANVTYPKPNSSPTAYLNHIWSQMIITYYYPNSYTGTTITQNGTPIFPTVSPTVPISQGDCSTAFCTNVHFVALNMTLSNPSSALKASINIIGNSINAEAGIGTTLGGVAATYWGPGDLLQVKVNTRQGVNVTGSNIVSANRTGIVRVSQTFANVRRGISLENFTTPLPQDTSLLGLWTVSGNFTNGYDYGFNSTSFTLEQLGVSGFTYSGNNQRLTTRGTLTYASTTSPAPNVNGYVFAIDSGSGAAPFSTPTVTSGTGMYISNITLLNGVFTTGEALTMTFTLVNPTGVAMNATLTIDHEWVTNTPHNSNATITIPSGDRPFLITTNYFYKLSATLTPAGIDIIVKGLSSGNSVSANLPPGNPPVTSLRQQAGLFKLTVTSNPASGSATSPCVPPCKNSLESPAYAYVLVNPPVPGRLLASASFTSLTTGSFSALITPGKILGATKLTFLSLGRDDNGLAITVQDKSTHESTILQSTIGNVPTVTENQPMTITLHLTSNSTIIDMNITISLNLQGIGVVQSQSGIYIPHGASKDVTFNFNAPASAGVYTLTFFSPDYGAPLITGTLQVSVLQSSLQIIIPAIIGLAAAIVILLFFLFRKKPAVEAEAAEKEKNKGTKPAKPSPGTSSSKSLT